MATGNSIAVDPNGMAALRANSRDDSRAGLRAAAQQFEAVFLQMVLKAMRETVPGGGPFDSNDARLYRDLLDQQYVQSLSKRTGTGLAELLEKQLGRALTDDSTAPAIVPGKSASPGQGRQSLPVLPRTSNQVAQTAERSPIGAAGGQAAGGVAVPQQVLDFIGRLWPTANLASRDTGIPAHFLVAHAALETGWGRSEIKTADGRPSHNLFNIKAGSSWQGPTADVVTTEYVDGVARKQVERFRAYASDAEAFADYAQLLKGRYAQVIGSRDAADFARGLQQGGYATDPMYADKLTRIIGGGLLRAGLAG